MPCWVPAKTRTDSHDFITNMNESPPTSSVDAGSVPAGTTTRFVLLIVAVLVTSSIMFMGLYFSVPANAVRLNTALACAAHELEMARRPFATLEEHQQNKAATVRAYECLVPAYSDQLSWVGYGTAGLFGLAGLLYWLHPWWRIHRHRLRPLLAEDAPELVAYLDRMCRQVGLPWSPTWLIAPFACTVSGVAFGRPRCRYVQLNAGLVTLFTTNLAAFRAVVLHELAHLRNRDVDKTYLTVSIWRAFVAVALIPYVVLILHPRLFSTPRYWSWTNLPGQARNVGSLVVLALLVYLTRNAILRVREIQADATAAAHDQPNNALRDLVRRLPQPSATFWRRWFDCHPHPGERLKAIDDPVTLARPSLWELAGIGITAGIFATHTYYAFNILFTAVRSTLGAPLAGLLTAILMTGLLAVTLWRATAANPTNHFSPRTYLLAPIVLAAGFLLGEPLTVLYANAAWGRLSSWPQAATFAITTLLLVAGLVLLSAWIISAIRKLAGAPDPRPRWAPPAIVVAATFATAPWFTVWFVMWLSSHTSNAWTPAMWMPVLGTPQNPASSISWYHALAGWTVLAWLFLESTPLVLLGPTLLWLVPVLTATPYRSPEAPSHNPPMRLGLALRAGLFGGLAVIVTTIILAIAAKTALPLSLRRPPSETPGSITVSFVHVYNATNIAVAVLAQALVAAVVATRARSHRCTLTLLATSLTATLATAGLLFVTDPVSRCIDLFGNMRCFGNIEAGYIARYLHWVTITGLVLAIPAALTSAAIATLWRRRHTSTDPKTQALPQPLATPTQQRPLPRILTATTITLVATAMTTATLIRLPQAWNFWARPPSP
jgi:Zn-dependent protease with chaperone function